MQKTHIFWQLISWLQLTSFVIINGKSKTIKLLMERRIAVSSYQVCRQFLILLNLVRKNEEILDEICKFIGVFQNFQK